MSSASPSLLQAIESLASRAGRVRDGGQARVAGGSRVRGASAAPSVMVVSELPLVRLAVGRELASGCELIHALGTASADRRLDVGASPELLVLDMDGAERGVVGAFLSRLVDRGFTGPRILLSAGFRPEASARFRASCLTHFALGRPWRPGELRSLVESVLGLGLPTAARRP